MDYNAYLLFLFLTLSIVYLTNSIYTNNTLVNQNSNKDHYNKDKNTCPKISCKDNIDECLQLRSDPDGKNKKIIISNDPCIANDYCPYMENEINENTFLNKYCSINTLFSQRYPGEDCLKSEDCYSNTSACIKGKCSGQELNEPCEETADCLVSLFCSNNMCKPQLSLGEACVDFYDCKNTLGCNNNKCINLLSLNPGQDLGNSTLPTNYFCKYGMADGKMSYNGVCDKFFYDMNRTVDSSGLMPCDYPNGEMCRYKFSLSASTFELYCQCSRNAEGTSYCMPDSSNTASVDNYNKVLLESFDNTCHTLNRFTCYQTENNSNLNTRLKIAEAKSVTANIYYKAPDCVITIPDEPSDILAFIGIGLLIIFLIWLVYFYQLK